MNTGRGAAAALAALLLTAACSTSVPGVPGAAPQQPLQVIQPPPVTTATVREAQRIAGVTALVQTTFPDRGLVCAPTGPHVEPAELDKAYSGAGSIAPILQGYGFVAAWGQCARSATGRETRTLVMELSDAESARRAAGELRTTAVSRGSGKATPIPGGSTAVVGGSGDFEVAEGWTSVGRMVAYAAHNAPAGQGAAGVDRLLADQVRLLRPFVPTRQADLSSLPDDPSNLGYRAVVVPGEVGALTGPYDLEGILRLEDDPLAERDLLTRNGLAGAYVRQSFDGRLNYFVYLKAFPSPTLAGAAGRGLASVVAATYSTGRPFRLPGAPDARCFVAVANDVTYYQRCDIAVGRYLATLDVARLARADDVAAMARLVAQQRADLAG